jgi:hypothetical protein
MRRAVLLIVVLAVAAAAAAPALADGDPASDYLITQSTFLPLDRVIAKSTSTELAAHIAAAQKAGFPVRVAVIATPYDLGAVPVLYRRPSEYARFLGQELYYWYRHTLLVVMPNGYGIYNHGNASAADRALVAKLPAPNTTSGTGLVAASVRAVDELAARRGIDLTKVKASGSSSSTGSDRIEIGVAAVAVLVLAAAFAFFRRRRKVGRR